MPIIRPKSFEFADYKTLCRRNKLNSFLKEFLEKNGYIEAEVNSLISEANIPNTAKKTDRYLGSYKLNDSDGSLLIIPDDIMLQLMMDMRLSADVSSRLFSIKNCYFFAEKGILRNLPQIGLMLFGEDNVAAEAEAVCIALALADALKLTDYLININDTRILSGVAKVYNRQEIDKVTLKSLLSGEANSEMDHACVTMLSSISGLKGKITDIKEIADKLDNKESINGLYNLLNLSELLEDYDCEKNVTYHTGYLGMSDYEDGFVFNLIADNQLLLHGGRYLIKCENETMFGIGIKINYAAVFKAFFADKEEVGSSVFDVLVGTGSTNLSLIKTRKLKDTFLESGIKVNVLYNKTMEELIAYSKKMGIESVIFVDNHGNIEYI